MTGTILQHKDKFSVLFYNVVRYAALITPFTAIGYALLASADYLPRSTIFSVEGVLLVCIFSVLVAVWQFVRSPTTEKVVFFFLALYHIMGVGFLLLISGFASPLVLLWVLLAIVADLNFSHRGMIYSLALLLGVALVDISLGPVTYAIVVQHLVYLTIISVTAIFVNRLRWVENVEHDELEKTKEERSVQESQLMTLINSVNEAILSTNAQGQVQVYNAATLNLLDTNQSLAGKRLDDLFHIYDGSGEPLSLFEVMSKDLRSVDRDDLEHRFADGEAIKLGISSSVIRNNHPTGNNRIEGYILVVRDITKSKSLEEERDEFISVVSHELRTPITITEGTISNLQFLLERNVDRKTFATSLNDAHEQVIYLAKMVNDPSTLSRAERGVADTPEEINVTDLMHELYSQYEAKALKKGLVLNLDIKGRVGTVTASRLYLEEMLQNFITNALKYTREGSVTLSAHRESDGVEFSVQDTGIGISKSDQKKIFEKFYRSEDYRTRETAGTGLGLYVVQKLSHKLGTKVELVSRLNHGSTFSFSLKASAPIDEKASEG